MSTDAAVDTFEGVIEWGDVPTWVQAVTTTAALIAAGIAVALEMNGSRQRDREMEARAEDLRRGQAELVAIWPSSKDYPSAGAPPTAPFFSRLMVRNGSDQPIFGLRLYVQMGPNDHAQGWNEEVLAPGSQTEVDLPVGIVMSDGSWSTPTNRAVSPENVRLVFMDAAGRGWWRSAVGDLDPAGERHRGNQLPPPY